MERELWRRLYHLVMEAGESFRLVDVSYQPHIIVLIFLWAVLHDRPVGWACDESNWTSTTLRPATIPSASTLSRRLRRLDTAMFMRVIVERIRETEDPRLIAIVDGKPLPVGGASKDPEAGCGHGAGMWDKGYKLYSIHDGRPIAAAYRVYSINNSEDTVAREMIPELTGGGYLLGDGEYDSNGVFDVAGAAGYQLLAPREDPKAGLGHHYQSPYRLRCIDLMQTPFGRNLFRMRTNIERDYGTLTSFGCGLAPLPAWVRHERRAWLWTTAKMVINAVRIMKRKGVVA